MGQIGFNGYGAPAYAAMPKPSPELQAGMKLATTVLVAAGVSQPAAQQAVLLGAMFIQALNDATGAGLDSRDLVALLRQLLKLPPDKATLYQALEKGNLGKKLTKTVIKQQTSKVVTQKFQPPEPIQLVQLPKVQQWMQARLDHSQANLLKLMQGPNVSYQRDVGSLGALVQQMAHMSEQIQESPVQGLQTLMMLYLPWNPNVPAPPFNIAFEPGKDDAQSGGGGEAEDLSFQMVVFIQTNTMGHLKLSLAEANVRDIAVVIEHEVFAEGKLGEVEKRFRGAWAQECRAGGQVEWIGIPRSESGFLLPLINLTSNPDEENQFKMSDYGPAQDEQQQVQWFPASGVSLKLIQAAILASQCVLELDNSDSLHAARSGLFSIKS